MRAASITAVISSSARVAAAAPGCVGTLGRLALPRPARAWARRRLASAGSGPLGFAESPRAPALLSHRSIRWLPPAKRSRTEQDESGGRLLRADGRAIRYLSLTALPPKRKDGAFCRAREFCQEVQRRLATAKPVQKFSSSRACTVLSRSMRAYTVSYDRDHMLRKRPPSSWNLRYQNGAIINIIGHELR